MPNLLQTHPPTHEKRNIIYFIPNTIKLRPEYQHLAKKFAPHLLPTHQYHPQCTNSHPHLHHYIHQVHTYPPTPPRILYALIYTIHPSLMLAIPSSTTIPIIYGPIPSSMLCLAFPTPLNDTSLPHTLYTFSKPTITTSFVLPQLYILNYTTSSTNTLNLQLFQPSNTSSNISPPHS
jgi:hypothetical protein